MSLSAQTIGSRQRINAFSSGSHDTPQLTSLSDGGWLATWIADRQDGSGSDIYQQRYDSSGRAFYESDRIINITSAGQQYDPSVTSLADGGWIVAWTSYGQDGSGSGIYQRRFDAQGQAQTGEIRVNQNSLMDQEGADVAALPDGGWLVTWTSYVSVGVDRWAGDIYQQRYSWSGQPLYSAEKLVNTVIADQQDEPSTIVLADGGWVVTWRSYNQDSSGFGVYQQRYDAQANVRGAETRINSTTLDNQLAQDVTALADGGWVVTWMSYGQDSGIYQQRYDQAGRALYAADKQVDALPGSTLLNSHVTALEDGGWLVTWRNADQEGAGIYHQRYAKSGAALLAVEQRIAASNDTITDPAVSALSDGSFVIAWNESFYDYDTGLSRDHLYQQRYSFEAPVKDEGRTTDIAFSGTSVREIAAGGALVGTFRIEGQDPGESFGYNLLDTAGGRFALAIQNGVTSVVVANGLLLDFEQGRSHAIKVQVTRRDGSTFTKSFDIDVNDVSVENILGSGRNDRFVGGSGNDTFRGGAGHDTLLGGAGKDKLDGGSGKDSLYGGSSKDVFVFSTKPSRASNVDRIMDYKVADDTIHLENKIFTKLKKTGTLKKDYFVLGSKAKDKNDFIGYNKKTGDLWYDDNGSKAGGQVALAKLAAGLKIAATEFKVI
jgi:hypothetical protein